MEELFKEYPGLVTAFGAFLIWALTRWAELVGTWRAARIGRKNFIRALYAEVDFNTRDLEFFLMNSANISDIEAAMQADPDLLPHITDAHHTIIYSQNIQNMHLLDDSLAARLVLFYGLLEKIKAQIDGMNLRSFQSISARGRAVIIKRLIVQIQQCEAEGRIILTRFSEKHTKLSLVRHARQAIDTKQG